jgi:HK97 family phage portal protein
MKLFRRRKASPLDSPNVMLSPRLVEVLRTWNDTPASYARVYRELAPVRTVVDFIADAVSSTSLKVYERAEQGRPEARGHPYAELLRSPNPDLTGDRFIGGVIRDLAIYGKSYTLKAQMGSARMLVPIPPTLMEPVGGGLLGPEGFNYMQPGGQPRFFSRDKVAYLRLYDPEDRRLGVSKLEALRNVLAEEVELGRWRKNFWRNSAKPGMTIHRPETVAEMSDSARDRFMAGVKQFFSGEGAGNTLLLEEGMTESQVGFNPKDSEYVLGRVFILEATARVFNLPLAVLSLTQTATFASQKEFKKQLYQDTLPTWYRLIESEFDAQILPWFDTSANVYAQFNIDSKLEGDVWEKFDTLSHVVGRPFATVEEARNILNWAPRPGSDDDKLAIPNTNFILEGAEPPAPPPPLALPAAPEPVVASLLLRSKDIAELEALLHPREPVTVATPTVPESVLARRDRQAKALEADLLVYMGRQERSAKSREGARVKAQVDGDRWNRELQELLQDHSLSISIGSGRRTALDISGTYDVQRTRNYITEVSRVGAEKINKTTQSEVAALGAADAFTQARARAGGIALSVVSEMNAFGRSEAGVQNGATTKTWIVTSAKSRHPQMDGEVVGIGQNFSNGLRWPGDSMGSADETAHCECLLDIGTGV